MIDIFNEIGFINPNGGTERTVKGEQISVNNASEQGSVVSMTEYVDPSQNLNGQTRPYPEMGGSNILPGADNVKNWVISGSSDVVNFYPYNMSSSSPWNLKTLKTTLSPIQSLNGYDSPWVGGAGKNKYPTTAGEDVWVNNASATHSNNNGELVIVCTNNANSGVYGNGQQRALINQQSVAKTVSFDLKVATATTITVQGNAVEATTSYTRKSITIPANTSALLSVYGRGTANTIYIKNLMISDDGSTDYAPYSNICPISGWDGVNVYVSPDTTTASATTYPVNLSDTAGTVYGGTLDVVSGELTVDRAMVDLGTLTYEHRSSYKSGLFSTSGLTDYKLSTSVYFICERYRSAGTVLNVGDMLQKANGDACLFVNSQYPTSHSLYILDEQYTSASDLKTALNGSKIVFELESPQTYQLTPTQIAMIVGNNYIWTDCGTITDASYYVSLTSATVYLRANSTGEILNTSKISSKFFSNTNRTLSFEHTASAALTVDIILAGTSGTASDNVWTRTRWGYLAQGVSLARTSTWTKYTLPATAFNEAKLTQGSGDVNSFYIQIVPSGKVDLRRFELENGSTATAWTPSANHAALLNTSNLYLYKRATPTASGTSYSKSLGRSVYYGKLEFKSGTLTVLGSVVTLNSTNQTWQSQTSGSNMRFYASISGMKSSTDASETLCTDFASTTSTSYTSPWGYYRISGTSIYISNYYYTQASGTKFFDTLADFKAWLDARETAGSPVQLLYPLATPQTYSLGTTTINLLSGMNYFDSGTSNRRIVEGTFLEPYLGLKRPNDFAIQREDIYAGEYTTCTGAVKADRIGWKYSDMEIVFDELTESELQFLIGMNGAVTFIFADSDGQHQENVIRAGFTNTPTRLTLPDGQAIWKNAGLSIRFIDAHN